jgi:arginyl-tRNA synthetase
VQKSDGSWTYFAPDIAYHYNKVQRGFDELINIFGADHSGYVKRLKAVVSALSENKVSLDIKLIQLVKLLKGGQIVKMSKRAGTFVTLRDLIDEVGPDVVRFVMLTRKNDVALDFDFDKVTEQSKDNPVFYVQYANARVNSILRKARDAGLDVSDAALSQAHLAHLGHEAELEVIRKLGEWPRLVEIAAKGHEPHRVAFYLYELASEFHGLWNKGNDDDSLRFIQGDTAISTAKIALARAVGVVICAGLGILGVTPVEEMR